MELTGEQFARRYATAIDHIPDGYSRAEVTANTTEDKWSFVRNKIISMQALKKGAPKFIVIDNITNGFGSIYSAKKMSKFVMDMKTLKERYGLTILLIAHCPKRNKRKPIDQDSLGGSKMLLNFVDSAFAIGTSLQDESVRYLKQVKCRECKKNKLVTTVQIKAQPYLSMWYVCDTDEENHTDPKSAEQRYYAFTPEEEIELVDWLTRIDNGEDIPFMTVSVFTHIPIDVIVSYFAEHFPNNK